MTALVAEDLGVRLRMDQDLLLRAVTLTLEPGDALRLGGRSGAGKSTLLRGLAALQPVEGTLRAGGASLAALGPAAWRRRVTLAAQRPHLFEGTVEANLRRAFGFASAEGTYDAARASELLDALELPGDVLARESRALSVGEQQRVGLVRTLLHRPGVALLDEPTSALDPETRGRVWALLERERSTGLAVVVVSHDDVPLNDLRTLAVESFRA